MLEDFELLESGQKKDYVYKQCLKMCFYLQKVRNIEILQMKTEFIEDDNKNIWFTYCSDIHYRILNVRKIEALSPKELERELKAK